MRSRSLLFTKEEISVNGLKVFIEGTLAVARRILPRKGSNTLLITAILDNGRADEFNRIKLE